MRRGFSAWLVAFPLMAAGTWLSHCYALVGAWIRPRTPRRITRATRDGCSSSARRSSTRASPSWRSRSSSASGSPSRDTARPACRRLPFAVVPALGFFAAPALRAARLDRDDLGRRAHRTGVPARADPPDPVRDRRLLRRPLPASLRRPARRHARRAPQAAPGDPRDPPASHVASRARPRARAPRTFRSATRAPARLPVPVVPQRARRALARIGREHRCSTCAPARTSRDNSHRIVIAGLGLLAMLLALLAVPATSSGSASAHSAAVPRRRADHRPSGGRTPRPHGRPLRMVLGGRRVPAGRDQGQGRDAGAGARRRRRQRRRARDALHGRRPDEVRARDHPVPDRRLPDLRLRHVSVHRDVHLGRFDGRLGHHGRDERLRDHRRPGRDRRGRRRSARRPVRAHVRRHHRRQPDRGRPRARRDGVRPTARAAPTTSSARAATIPTTPWRCSSRRPRR